MELRHLRQEAREGTRLLEDKKALETRVAELMATLALVQDQRNELRQVKLCKGRGPVVYPCVRVISEGMMTEPSCCTYTGHPACTP